MKGVLVRKWVKLAISAAAMSVLLGGLSWAGSTTGTLAISADVANNCVIGSSPAVNFSSYDPIVGNASSDLDVNGTLTLTCTQGAVATIAMDTGANASHAIGTTRAMANGSNYLSYELYSDSGLSTVWGTGGSAVTEPAAPSDAAVNYTVYGKVPAGQDVPAGSYSDTVNVTVNF
jgi:spore coat protein U domain-containing protein, fimbrial subunit CupE1/2/3/6